MKSLKLHHSRRWWIVVGTSGAIIVGAAIYILYSVFSWQAYQQRTVSWHHSTKQALTSTFSLKSTSDEERKQKLAAFKAVATNMHRAQASICNPARLTGWQLAISGAREAREKCGSYSQKIGRVVEQLDKVTAYLDDESTITKALQPATSLPETVNEANWDQTAATWSKTYTEVSSVSSSVSFAVTKQQITTVVADIDTSWKGLVAAHAKKDKTSFVAATTKLQASYTALASINTVNDSQLSLLATQLQQMYDGL